MAATLGIALLALSACSTTGNPGNDADESASATSGAVRDSAISDDALLAVTRMQRDDYVRYREKFQARINSCLESKGQPAFTVDPMDSLSTGPEQFFHPTDVLDGTSRLLLMDSVPPPPEAKNTEFIQALTGQDRLMAGQATGGCYRTVRDEIFGSEDADIDFASQWKNVTDEAASAAQKSAEYRALPTEYADCFPAETSFKPEFFLPDATFVPLMVSPPAERGWPKHLLPCVDNPDFWKTVNAAHVVGFKEAATKRPDDFNALVETKKKIIDWASSS